MGVALFTAAFSQNVAINTTGVVANTSAMLDISSTNSGLLIPRVALTATNLAGPVTAPATSLMVYNTATASAGLTAVTPGYYYWDGTQWVRFITGALPGPDWMVTGNAGTNPAIHFAGTTDAVDFVIRTNNTEKMRITSGGFAGIGISVPVQRLDVQGGNARINNTFIGDVGHGANWGGFSHYNQANTTGYAILESVDGAYTLINKQNTGSGYIGFRVANADQAVILNNGNMGIATINPQVRLAVSGAGANVYATDVWVENNMHVQGNEALTQGGGRGRLRVGTAWGYDGLYTETGTSGVNDLILGASSGTVRVGPGANTGQHLRWANSQLRDDQGGSMELGGSNLYGQGGIGTPYIDWHINDGFARDYDFRMIGGTDGNGDILTMWTYGPGNTLYRYLDLDWIGAQDCWADVSAWRYWANAANGLYQDVVNDLDIIDGIRPKAIIDPKSNQYSVINDPLTVPSFIMSKTNDGNNYAYDIGATATFSIGAIRMLRKETQTSDDALDARIDRLEKLVEQLTGQTLGDIDYKAEATAFAGIVSFVVMDARVTKDSKITFDGLSNYEIVDQREGSFTIKFNEAPVADIHFTYSGKF